MVVIIGQRATNLFGEVLKKLIGVYVAFFLVLSLLFNSCTDIGLGIGIVKDLTRPNYETIQIKDLIELKQYNKILIHLNNDSLISGTFYEILSDSVDGLESNNYSLKTVIILNKDELESISVNSIFAIEKKNSNYSWLRWGLAGLALDLFLFEVMRREM